MKNDIIRDAGKSLSFGEGFRVRNILLLGMLFSSVTAFTQIKEEKLILDRKREPEVKKIEKKKTSVETIKNYPPEEKSQTPVNYEVTDVPSVSDFKTSTIQGSDISPKFGADYQTNYVGIGAGNYSKFLADANFAYQMNEKTEVGGDAHFLTSGGLKQDYPWNSRTSDVNFGAFLNAYTETGKFNVNLDVDSNTYNYYGIYGLKPASDIDIQQKVGAFRLNAYYDHYSNEILNDVRLKTSFLNDNFDAKESFGNISANFSKHGVNLPLDDVKMNADLGVGISTLKTEFAILNQNSSNYFEASANPTLTFRKGNSYLMIGSGFSYLNSKLIDLAALNSEENSKTYWFPRAEILFAGSENANLYIGITGGLHHNSYAEILKENPYAVSDQVIKPTETKYSIYFGIRGDVDQLVKYDLSAGLAKVNNIMFFSANNIFDQFATLNRAPYNYANVFSATYDNGSISSVKAGLSYFPLENLSINLDAAYFNYKLKNYADIYNKPMFTATIGANYAALQKKLLLGFKGFLSSQKTTNSFAITDAVAVPPVYLSVEDKGDKIGGFADLNLSAEYKFHKNFSIFALGNNLLNTKYESYKGYKVLGAQILGGVKISF